MARNKRRIEAGTIYHVLNRGNGRRMLFSKEGDFIAFIKLLEECFDRFEVDLFAFCLMGNHWHLLVRPLTDESVSRCMAWLTVTHARRHHRHYPNPGSGHLYQGRFKCFPVQSDEHFLTVARYIHANPVRAGLVKRVRDWPWNELSGRPAVASWPVDRPRNWTSLVDRALDEEQAQQLENSLKRGTPYGSTEWVKRTADRLDLAGSLRSRGRPPKPIQSLSARQIRRRRRAERT